MSLYNKIKNEKDRDYIQKKIELIEIILEFDLDFDQKRMFKSLLKQIYYEWQELWKT